MKNNRKPRYAELCARAERTAQMIIKRAREVSKEAGLDPSLLGIHPHNAMCSLHYGKPWPGIDYSKVRKCLWLIQKSYEPSAILSRLYKRIGHEGFDFSRGGAA